jgi:selenophosphate synthetase-related protein
MGCSPFQNCICDCVVQDIEEKSRRINSRIREEDGGRGYGVRQVGGHAITKAHSCLFATAAIYLYIQTQVSSCETCG